MTRHELTPEDRSKGGKASAQKRRELGMSFRERLAVKLDERADEVVQVFLDAMEAKTGFATKDGDLIEYPDFSVRLRAAVSALHEAFGKPPASLEVTGEGGGPIEVAIKEARDQLAARLTDIADRRREE